MKRSFFIAAIAVLSTLASQAQEKFYTKTGKILFKCTKSPLEKIEATNKSGTCVLDAKTGNLQFAIMMKGFEFERALMQEHFNENYLESDKFPKSVFIGRIDDISKVDFDKDAEYAVTVTGQLTIHGVTRTVTAPAILSVKNRVTIANATFNISLTDYKISIPSLVKDKISETVKISVTLEYES